MGSKYNDPKETERVIFKVCNEKGLKTDKLNYINCRTDITVGCEEHGYFNINPQTLTRSSVSCAVCDKLSGRPYRNLSVDQYKIYASIIHNNKYDYSLIQNLKTEKIPVICQTHGVFYIRSSAHIAPKQLYGCQKCGTFSSKGEEKIKDWLLKNNYSFSQEKRFSDLKNPFNNNPLRFDFFLSDEKLVIEFDGKHHFELVQYGTRQSTDSQAKYFENTKINDRFKAWYCGLYDYKLLRIPYWEYINIETILENYFN